MCAAIRAQADQWPHIARGASQCRGLAFLPVSELAILIRSRKVRLMELTRLYLDRLKRFDPLLKCVVNLTEDLALEQAARADQEIAASASYRWTAARHPVGAKDLIAYPGYPTTWGATPFKDRVIDVKATVAARLEEAGAVLVAKLSLGALAMGDVWFGGRTRSPCDPRDGLHGSSAPALASAVAGRLWSGFMIGSETLAASSLRAELAALQACAPTFGRVSRHGCMTLSWSMDKLGPIARSIEDCALIFDAIHGTDGLDWAAVDQPFEWPAEGQLYEHQGRLHRGATPTVRGSRRVEGPPQARLRAGADQAAG